MTSAEIKAQLAAIVDDLARRGTPRIVIVGDQVNVIWAPPLETLIWLLPQRVLSELEASVTELERREKVEAVRP